MPPSLSDPYAILGAMAVQTGGPRGTSPRFRRWVPVVGLGLAIAGCSSAPPDPEPAAQSLAAALSTLDVSGVGFVGQSASAVQDDLDSAVAGMSGATLVATVADTTIDETPDEPEVSATLEMSWDLDGDGPGTQTWVYETQALLATGDEESEQDWQVLWDRSVLHPDLSGTSVLSLTRNQAQRADVVGADGAVLVTDRAVERVGIDKLRLDGVDPEPSARELAELVGVDADVFVERVEAAGDEAFVEAIVLREDDAAPLRPGVDALDGARIIADRLPLAPSREFARPLLGSVGPATAEVVEASGGAVAATDIVGLSGLQARYDEQLRGTPGHVVEAVSDDGATRDELHATAPTPGDPLVLTLDLQTQQLADDLLGDVDSPSALVALRPSSGELVAVASGTAAGGYSTATLGQYAPGSIFKIVTADALLQSDVGPDSLLPCTESVTVDGKVFTNYSDYPSAALGDIELRTAFAESCNTAFVSQVDVVDWPTIADAAASLGIGTPVDLGFDAFLGAVGEPSSRVEQAAGNIGQGTVLFSPLGAATMAASASVGPVTPVLVDQAGTASDEPVTVAPGENEQLMDMMRLAVTNGTAEVLADVPGPPVAAKTGTAEFGSATPPDTHGWMVAVQGDLAVAVFVEDAESGSSTAGPILREFLTAVEASLLSDPAAASP